MATAQYYFAPYPRYRIAVCKQCGYAVFPDHCASHLKGRHPGLSSIERSQIVNNLYSWPDCCLSTDKSFLVPTAIEEPIPDLPTFTDGLQCKIDPARCRYVCRSQATLRKHWASAHSWGIGNGRRGGSRTAMSQRAAEDRRVNAYTPVHCQRFFMQGGHATFVVILSGEPELCQLRQQAETPDNDLAHTVL
jgi:hypothetical protein